MKTKLTLNKNIAYKVFSSFFEVKANTTRFTVIDCFSWLNTEDGYDFWHSIAYSLSQAEIKENEKLVKKLWIICDNSPIGFLLEKHISSTIKIKPRSIYFSLPVEQLSLLKPTPNLNYDYLRTN